MLQGNKLKFQRGATAKAEDEDRNSGGQNRHHALTLRPARENLQCCSALWIWGKDNTAICAGSARFQGRVSATAVRCITSAIEKKRASAQGRATRPSV